MLLFEQIPKFQAFGKKRRPRLFLLKLMRGVIEVSMIRDGFWKLELNNAIHLLVFWKWLSFVFDVDYVKHKANKHILLMAVAARKMVDDELQARKETEQSSTLLPEFPLVDYKIPVTEYPFIGEKDWFIPGRIIGSDYGRATGVNEMLLNKLCSQIIHSFVWGVAGRTDKKGICGFLVASEKAKDKQVYYISIDDWITAMRFCSKNASV